MIDPNVIQISRNLTFYGALSLAGVVNSNVACPANIGFEPDYAVIKHITINTDQANYDNVYVLFSSLDLGSPITSFGIPGNITPNLLINCNNKRVDQLTFFVSQVGSTTTSTLGAPSLPGTWFMGITIDFIKLKQSGKVIATSS